MSRRTSSAVICLILATVVLAVPITPLLSDLLPTWHWQFAGLEATGAFTEELPRFIEMEQRNPFHGRPEELDHEPPLSSKLPIIVMSIWGLGALVFLVVRLWTSLNVKLRYAKSVPLQPEHPSVQILQNEVCSMGLKHTPWLLLNPNISGPQTSGIIRPSILIPSHFEKLDHEDQAMILHHELAHIQRRDVLVRVSLEAVAVVFWFHPIIWLMLKRYDLETEKACDDSVIHRGYPAHRYAEILLTAAQSSARTGNAFTVRQRIKSILLSSKNRSPLRGESTIGFISLVSIFIVLPLSLVTLSPYPAAVKFDPLEANGSLRALWKMKLNRGSFLPDWSGNNRHGKIIGAEWVIDAERGACLSFDGDDDYLVLRAPEADWTREPFSVCVWLKPAQDADGGGLLLKGDLNDIWSSAVGDAESPTGGVINFSEREISLAAGEYDGSSTIGQRTFQPGMHPTLNYFNLTFHRSAAPLRVQQWTHLAIVSTPSNDKRGPSTRFYLNAELVHTEDLFNGAAQENMDWPTQLWYFARGESPLNKGNHYEGLVSDLVIYQRALSVEEVTNVMDAQYILEE